MPFSRARRELREPRDPRAGTVTRLVAQQHDADRVSVYLDGDFAFGVHRDLVLEHGLHKGRALTHNEATRLLAADDRLQARSRALSALSTRARTRHELATRLRDDGFDAGTIEAALAWLAGRGLLDDAAYAQQYADSRRAAQGFGPERIRQELRRRGIDAATAQAATEGRGDDEETLALALAQAERRWASLAREPDARKRRKKLFDFLVRRGFGFGVARLAVERVAEASLDDDDEAQ